MPISPIRTVKIGTISSDGAKLEKLQKNAGVTAAPTATPSIVRIPSLKGLKTFQLDLNGAVIKQLVKGPNKHGKGAFNRRKEIAPARAIK